MPDNRLENIRKIINSDSFESRVTPYEMDKLASVTQAVVQRSVDSIWQDVRNKVDEITTAKAEQDGITYEQALNEITQQLMEGKES